MAPTPEKPNKRPKYGGKVRKPILTSRYDEHAEKRHTSLSLEAIRGFQKGVVLGHQNTGDTSTIIICPPVPPQSNDDARAHSNVNIQCKLCGKVVKFSTWGRHCLYGNTGTCKYLPVLERANELKTPQTKTPQRPKTINVTSQEMKEVSFILKIAPDSPKPKQVNKAPAPEANETPSPKGNETPSPNFPPNSPKPNSLNEANESPKANESPNSPKANPAPNSPNNEAPAPAPEANPKANPAPNEAPAPAPEANPKANPAPNAVQLGMIHAAKLARSPKVTGDKHGERIFPSNRTPRREKYDLNEFFDPGHFNLADFLSTLTIGQEISVSYRGFVHIYRILHDAPLLDEDFLKSPKNPGLTKGTISDNIYEAMRIYFEDNNKFFQDLRAVAKARGFTIHMPMKKTRSNETFLFSIGPQIKTKKDEVACDDNFDPGKFHWYKFVCQLSDQNSKEVSEKCFSFLIDKLGLKDKFDFDNVNGSSRYESNGVYKALSLYLQTTPDFVLPTFHRQGKHPKTTYVEW